MILASRQEVDWDLDFSEIDGYVGEINPSGVLQHVLVIHIAQIEAVHRCGHARRIRIPIQKVERGRITTHQIVVHKKEPDQVVFSQKIKCLRHMVTFEVTKAIHVLVGQLELGVIKEYRNIANIGKVEKGREQGGTG